MVSDSKILDLSSIRSYIYKVLDPLRLLINDKCHRCEVLILTMSAFGIYSSSFPGLVLDIRYNRYQKQSHFQGVKR